MTFRKMILRLEEVLQSWEEHQLLIALSLYAIKRSRGEDVERPNMGISHDFRKFLLRTRQDTEMDPRFLLEDRDGPIAPAGSPRFYNYDALFLMAWTGYSRKVYVVPQDMQTLLMHTSLHGITWGEVKLPFDAFSICIETPIQVGEDRYDCFVLSRDASGRVIVHASGPNKQPWAQAGPLFIDKLRKLCLEKRWDELQEVIDVRYEFRDQHAPPTLYLGASPEDEPIEETHEWLGEHGSFTPDFLSKIPEMHLIYRLVAGLCLYITSLPGRVTKTENKKRAETIGRIDRSAVVNGADIMTVANSFTLTKGDEDFLRMVEQGQRGEVCAHWRRGFWRRTPGTGHIADAPKNQWIRPTLIRGDRLPEDGVPGGTVLFF